MFYFKKKIIIENNKQIFYNEVIWDDKNYYVFVLYEVDYIQNINLIDKFFKQFWNLDIEYTIVMKSMTEIIFIQLCINDKGLNKTYIIKNYLNLVGIPLLEAKKNTSSSFEEYKKLHELWLFIIKHEINPQRVYSAYNVLWLLYRKKYFNFYIYNIKLYQEILNIENFIYKYYIILKDKIKISYLPSHYGEYDYIIKYKYISNQLEMDTMKSELINLNLFEKNLHSKLQKLVKENKNFFDKILYFLNTNFPTCTLNEDIYFKNFLFGGRREVYGNILEKKDDFYVINCDIPSAYFQSLYGMFPEGTHKIEITNDQKNIKKNAFYCCEVEWSCNKLPILPFRGDRVIFPEGKFTGTWFGEELLLFLEFGGIIKNMYYEYTWVDWTYKYKDLADYLNNYQDEGKWILKKLKTTFFGSMAVKQKRIKKFLIKKHKILTEFNDMDIKSTNIYNACIITSRCRIELYKIIQILTKKNIKILYVHTDSIDFYCSLNDFNTLKQEYPEYKRFWEKNSIFKDSFYINTTTIFRQSLEHNYYVEQNSKLVYSEKDISIIKQKFFHTTDEWIIINGKKIILNSYKHREWDKTKLNTTSLKI